MGKEDLQYFYAELTGDSLSPSLGCDILFFFDSLSEIGAASPQFKILYKKQHHKKREPFVSLIVCAEWVDIRKPILDVLPS